MISYIEFDSPLRPFLVSPTWLEASPSLPSLLLQSRGPCTTSSFVCQTRILRLNVRNFSVSPTRPLRTLSLIVLSPTSTQPEEKSIRIIPILHLVNFLRIKLLFKLSSVITLENKPGFISIGAPAVPAHVSSIPTDIHPDVFIVRTGPRLTNRAGPGRASV